MVLLSPLTDMNQLFETDIHNCIDALEDYLITWEDQLIEQNAGDDEWNKLEPYKRTLNNLKYLLSIYG